MPDAQPGEAPAGPSAAQRGSGDLPPAGFLLLAALTLFWGSNWPAMKIILGELSPWGFRLLCLLPAGFALLAIARLSGLDLRVPKREIGPLLLCAVFAIAGWHLFTAHGVSLIPAGRAVIIAFTMPLWASLMAAPLLGEALTRRKLLGLGLGLGGLACLLGPEIAVLGTAPLGSLLVLVAAISWALGSLLLKRFAWTTPTIVLAGWQLLAGGLPVTVGALLIEGVPDPTALSPKAQVALIYTITFPMIFCHWAWFKLIGLFPAAIAAIGTLAIPVVGVFASALLLGEAVGPAEVAALILVCLGLAVVLVGPALFGNRKKKRL